MAKQRKTGVDGDGAEQKMRDAEVLRAKAELAAYFKGHRTEREARAALKIIKAFVRERERGDPKSRRPLPGLAAPATPRETTTRSVPRDAGTRRARKARRAKREPAAKRPVGASPDRAAPADHPEAPTEE